MFKAVDLVVDSHQTRHLLPLSSTNVKENYYLDRLISKPAVTFPDMSLLFFLSWGNGRDGPLVIVPLLHVIIHSSLNSLADIHLLEVLIPVEYP